MFVDALTPAFVKCFPDDGVRRVVVLQGLAVGQEKLSSDLQRRGIEIAEADFFAGHLRTETGESAWLASRRLAGEIAFAAAKRIVSCHPLLAELNTRYGRETLRLSLTKHLVPQIEADVLKIMVVRSLGGAGAKLWLARPSAFPTDVLTGHFPDVQLRFYPVAGSLAWRKLRNLALDLARHASRLLGYGSPRGQQSSGGPGPCVLMVQEENVRQDRTLRMQFHWLDPERPPGYTTHVANLRPYLLVEDGIPEKWNSAIGIVSSAIVRRAWARARRVPPLRTLMDDRRRVLGALISATDPPVANALLHVSQLMMEGLRMGAIAQHLQARVFLTSQLSSDPIQLVAEPLGVKTIAFQYSNLSMQSPLMMATADCYVVFSEMYKSLFQHDGIGPREWLTAGYPYDGIAALVASRAAGHRRRMLESGARFIACYLDESVQHDRWGLVSKETHREELHALLGKVLEDDSFGLIVKSQFMKNTPSRLYPDDPLMAAAMRTGRYLELHVGKHRNDVYPVEAALASDLCIGHKFGATAALEAALAGVRTVLLDTHGSRTPWDELYRQANIEFETMELLMNAMSRFRAEAGEQGDLGDWTPILHNFDPYRDGRAAERLRQEIDRRMGH